MKHVANAFIIELESAVPSAAKFAGGDVLDMWQVYKSAASQPEVFSELTFYDTLSFRDGLLFPDFFNAVNTFVKEKLKNHKPVDRSTLERELEETFTAMHNNWGLYEPFFNQHPELRYLKKQRMFSFALKEFASQLTDVRSLEASLFWSLDEYHQLRGNLELYVRLDEALRKQSLGTVFKKRPEGFPGTILAYLKPYGAEKDEIAPYLPLLKHGNVVGFCNIAMAEIGWKQFVAVTSLQTDLMRRDYVKSVRSDLGLPTTFFPDVKKNEGGRQTVPANITRPYLNKHRWVHKMLEAIEEASANTGFDGVLVATTDFFLDGPYERKRIIIDRLSEYNQGSYDVVPGKRGYKNETAEVKFPLTNQAGSGSCWIKSFR